MRELWRWDEIRVEEDNGEWRKYENWLEVCVGESALCESFNRLFRLNENREAKVSEMGDLG